MDDTVAEPAGFAALSPTTDTFPSSENVNTSSPTNDTGLLALNFASDECPATLLNTSVIKFAGNNVDLFTVDIIFVLPFF